MKRLGLRILALIMCIICAFSAAGFAYEEKYAVGEGVSTSEAGVSSAYSGKSASQIYVEYEWEQLALTNQFRINNGREPLTMFAGIQEACDVRAVEISKYFDHERPDGRMCFTALDEAGVPYSSAGENIAAGHTDPEMVTQGWIASPGHRENMLDPDFNHMGVGYYPTSGGYRHHWVQLFCSRYSEAIKDVYLEGADFLIVKKGKKISDMGIVLHEKNSVYGDCVCPVIDEMCTGYDPDKLGVQTVTVNFRGRKVKFDVNVTEDGAGIRLNKASAGVALGRTLQLTAEIFPESLANLPVEWVSSDESVAAVDENGLVTGVGKGKCTVTAKTENGMKASCKVEVSVKKVTKLKFDVTKYSVTLKKGDSLGGSFQINAEIKPKNASITRLKWKSSNKNVATVDENGVVTIVGFGKCTITAKTTDGSKKTASCAVTVGKKNVKSVTLAGNVKMKAGEVQNLTAAIKPKKAFEQGLKWKSSNPDVATVDENGTVTAIKKGKVTITCISKDNKKIKAKINIKITK